MPRQPRNAPGGYAYHVINRANGRLRLFRKDADFLAFEKTLLEAARRRPTLSILDWCVMSNHWHFVVMPRRDDDLTEFFRWLTHTHTQRWHAHHGTSGTGHVYQGRFKCFPIEHDEHLERVLRYVQLNPARAGIVKEARAWRWGSCHLRESGAGSGGRRGSSPDVTNDDAEHRKALSQLLGAWPIRMPRNWTAWRDHGLTRSQLEEIQTSITRSRPLGAPAWTSRTASKLGLAQSLRPRGRPKRDVSRNESRPL